MVEDDRVKTTDGICSPSIKAMVKLQSRHSNVCSVCKKVIKNAEEAVSFSTVGSVITYCVDCCFEKMAKEGGSNTYKPIFTFELILVLVVIFAMSTGLMFVKAFWFIPPFLYVALVIDIYHLAYEAIDRRNAQKIRDHYNDFGTYNIYRKDRQSNDDMMKEDESREEVSHLIDKMKDYEMAGEITRWDIFIFDLKAFLTRIRDALSYLKLTMFFLMYAFIIIVIFASFYSISNLING